MNDSPLSPVPEPARLRTVLTHSSSSSTQRWPFGASKDIPMPCTRSMKNSSNWCRRFTFSPWSAGLRRGRIAAVQGAKDAQGDVYMGGVDEFGARTSNDADKTITRRDAGRFSRTGRVVEKPDPGAPHNKIIEYHQYLMSGRGMTSHFLDF